MPTITTPPLTPEYSAEDVGRPLFDVSVAFIVVETLFFALYITSKFITKGYNGIDTWCLVPLSYLVNMGHCVLGIDITTGLMLQVVEEFLYGTSTTLPKLTILILYLKVLREKWARRITWVVALIVVLNAMAIFLTAAFICHPFAANWDKSIPGHCGDYMIYYRCVSVPNIVTDLAILVLPLPTLYKLQISPAKKVGLVLTFLTGGL
ncbi:MAG: hypothetical protein Q9160_005953 [Pyrenula sp. 1 TL-2023]